MADQSRLTWALVLSVLLHGLLLTLMPFLRHASLDLSTQPKFLDVDVLPAPKAAAKAPAVAAPEAAPVPPVPAIPIPKTQIVTPPDAGEEKEPDNARLLSDRNNTVKEEMLKRGDPAAGAPEAQAKPAPPPAANAKKERVQPAPNAQPEPSHAKTQMAALPKLDQLLPSTGDLIREGVVRPQDAPRRAPDQQASINRNLLPGRGESFSARPGIRDYLPTVRESDITLLNTKAERFAPFVRRVAARIFQHLEMRLKQAVGRGFTGSGQEFAVVEAVMSKQGKMLSARVVQRESNSTLSVDRELLGVTQPDVFFDQNPPAGAEGADGNIHFVLLVDLMVVSVVDPRTGAPSSGYQGVAGVGLDAAPKHD